MWIVNKILAQISRKFVKRLDDRYTFYLVCQMFSTNLYKIYYTIVLLNTTFCSAIWHFCSKTNTCKIEEEKSGKGS